MTHQNVPAEVLAYIRRAAAGPDGPPSASVIAEHLKVSRRTVNRTLARLVANGQLEKSGSGPTTAYRPISTPTYAQTFPNSAVTAVHHAPGDYPASKQGQVLTVEFTVLGVPCLGLNGGPAFKHSEAFSFQIVTDTQAETDRYWNAIVDNGGAESMCGWCKDRWGLSWQITPRTLLDATTDPDRAAAKRAFEAMMKMKKIDIAAIEAARRGIARA